MITHEEYIKRRDAYLCIGLPYMNDDWAKYPNDQETMIAAFKATKGYKEAQQAIDALVLDVIGEYDTKQTVPGYKQHTFYRNNLRSEQSLIVRGES